MFHCFEAGDTHVFASCSLVQKHEPTNIIHKSADKNKKNSVTSVLMVKKNNKVLSL